jgi:hypothetical protein
VKTEEVISSEEEKFIDIKDEEGLHSEEKVVKDMHIQEEEDIEIKEEVRMRIQCNFLRNKG